MTNRICATECNTILASTWVNWGASGGPSFQQGGHRPPLAPPVEPPLTVPGLENRLSHTGCSINGLGQTKSVQGYIQTSKLRITHSHLTNVFDHGPVYYVSYVIFIYLFHCFITCISLCHCYVFMSTSHRSFTTLLQYKPKTLNIHFHQTCIV